MVAITEIMARTGASKDQVEEVAKGMGFETGNDYPDEIEAWVVANQNLNFDDDKFKAPPSQVMPWCQMINPQWSQEGIKPYGLAVTQENANLVGFKPDQNWQQVEYTFGSGEVTTLWLAIAPQLVVVRRGPVLIKDRTTGITLGRLAEHYDTFMTEKVKFKTFTRYLIFLVGQKKLLHQSPLRLTTSGAAGASFGAAFRSSRGGQLAGGFTVELEKAYAAYRRQLISTKGQLFHAHGIFCPVIDSVVKGVPPQTALVAATVDYGHPTAENLADYLIPSNSEESKIICETFAEYQDFGKEQLKSETAKMEPDAIANDFNDEYDFDQAPY